MTNLTRSTLIGLGVSTLLGCGGGGGGSDGGGSAAPLATITASNAPLVASAVLDASLQSADLGSFAGFGTLAPQKAGAAATASAKPGSARSNWLDVVVKQTQTRVAQAPIGPQTTPCANGGSVTISGNLADPSTLSPNDTIVADFAACDDGDAIVNGRFGLTITSLSGDLDSEVFSFGVTMQLTTFAVTVEGETATANGSIALNMSALPGSITTTVTSSSIAISAPNGTHTLSNYSLTQTVNGAGFTRDLEGTLSSTAFSGAVNFETTTLLAGSVGEFAFTGRVVITGANNATIAVIALDASLVRLEIDTNGDGTVDQTIDTTWAELV